jgi:hypothetical protein
MDKEENGRERHYVDPIEHSGGKRAIVSGYEK